MGAGPALSRLRIALATAGRFHVLDLARELDALGYAVRFHSHVPRARAAGFGLPPEVHVGMLGRVWPWVGMQRLFPEVAKDLVEARLWRGLNRALEATLEPCDVLVAMSGMYLEALESARRRFGAKIVLVRGSKHILAQDEILARTPGAERPSRRAIERELAGYALADMIAVPSRHVARSFGRDAAALAKLKVNPYGVDLSRFPLLPSRASTESPTVVFAGLWCLRKGCDLLEQAIRADERFRLVHVGTIGDYAFPHGHPRFRHVPKVDQSELSAIYREADAFVQPSREEGLSNVITQAVASGLPVLCTDATGGEDLRHTATLADRIDVVRAERMDALAEGLHRLALRLRAGPAFAPLTEADREALSWRAFARRYADNLEALCAGDAGRPPAHVANGSD
jgi:glycosyltransferase involved in cell wall biosynthesis